MRKNKTNLFNLIAKTLMVFFVAFTAMMPAPVLAEASAAPRPRMVGRNINEIFKEKGYDKGFIDEFEVTDKLDAYQPGDEIAFNFKFSIPNDVREEMNPGDFYEFNVPEISRLSNRFEFPLVDDSGEHIATAVANPDGTVRIEFNEGIIDAYDIGGAFELNGRVKEADEFGPGEHEIKIPFEDSIPGVPIVVKPKVDGEVAKHLYTDADKNPSDIHWDIVANLSSKEVRDVSIIDTPADSVLVTGIKVDEVKVDFAGEVTESIRELVEGVDYELIERENGEFEVKVFETDKPFRVQVESKVNPDSVPESGGYVYLRNDVVYDEGDSDHYAYDDKNVEFTKPLSKRSNSYSNTEHEYEWTVDFNTGKEKLNEVSFVDRISPAVPEHKLLTESVVANYITYDYYGNRIENPIHSSQVYVTDRGDGSYEFMVYGEEYKDKHIEFKYKTKYDGPIHQDMVFSNTVESDGFEDKAEVTQYQSTTRKSSHRIDFANDEMDWNITINEGKRELVNFELKDRLQDGLTYKGGMMIYDFSSQTYLTEGVDFEIVEYDNGYDLKLIGNYKRTNAYLSVTYTTTLDTDLLDEAENGYLYNSLVVSGQYPDGEEFETDVTGSFNPDDNILNNGKKEGVYDPTTRKVTWAIYTDGRHKGMPEGVKIIDELANRQEFVEGSLKAYEYKYDYYASRIESETEVALDDVINGFEITEKGENQVLEIVMKERDYKTQLPIVFKFETTLENVLIHMDTLENMATINYPDGKTITVTDDVEIPHGTDKIAKEGKQNSYGDVEWDILINESGSRLESVEVIDTLSKNQFFIEDEYTGIVKVEELYINADGSVGGAQRTLDPEEYDVVLELVDGAEQITISFKDEIREPHRITYKTGVIPSKESRGSALISNNARIKGENKDSISEDSPTELEVEISQGSGTAYGTRGDLEITKVDDEGNALAGAVFQLYRPNMKNKAGQRVVTDENGKATISRLASGDYRLVEEEAPFGFEIDDKFKFENGGHPISLKYDDDNKIDLISVKNNAIKREVTFEKVDENKTQINGDAVFLITNVDTKEEIELDVNGSASLELPMGKYTLEEISAPEGYVKSDEIYKFEVTEAILVDGVTQIVNEYKEHEVEITKVDEYQNKLNDVVYEIVDVSSQETIEVEIKDGKAMVELKPGAYTIQEVSAPNHLVMDEKVYDFIVNLDGTTSIELDFVNEIKTKTVPLMKKDENDNLIEGAKFELKNLDTKEVEEIILGAKMLKLKYGNYSIKEIEAPAGFILDEEEKFFSIDENGQIVGDLELINLKQEFDVEINKTDDLGNPLTGVEYQIFSKEGGGMISRIKNRFEPIKVTTVDGKATAVLTMGKYTIVETKTVEGYIKDTNVYEFEVFADGTTSMDLDFVNDRVKTNVSFNKVDQEGVFIPGAVFEIKNKDVAEEVYEIEVTENFELELPMGDYELREIKAPAGYKKDETVYEFSVNADKTTIGDREIINQLIEYDFELEKVGHNDKPLSDVVFEIVNKDTDEAMEVVTKDGKASFKLTMGDYTIQEIKTNAGYVLDEKVYEFSVDANGKTDFEFKFTNSLDEGNVEFFKKDELGNEINGATFEITNKEDKTVYELVVNGSATIKLPVGKYEFKEIIAPAGYDKVDTVYEFEVTTDTEVIGITEIVNTKTKYDFSLSKTGHNGANLSDVEFLIKNIETEEETIVKTKDGKADFKLTMGDYTIEEVKTLDSYVIDDKVYNFTVDADGQTDFEFNFTNELKETEVEFTKVDENDEPLSGAKFKVESLFDDSVYEFDVDQVHTLNLKVGDYKLVELEAPYGYHKDTKEYFFTVNPDLSITGDTKIVNKKITFDRELTKVNDAGQKLDGVEFLLTHESGREQVLLVNDGKADFTLEVGKYTLQETKTATGHILDDAVYTFEVMEDGSTDFEFDFINKRFEADVVFRKVDEDGRPVSGAVFEIENLDTNEVYELAVNEEATLELPYGKYEVREKVAPAAHTLTKEVYHFEVTDDKDVIDVEEIVNNRMKFNHKLTKVNDANQALSGVEYKITNIQTGEVLEVETEAGLAEFSLPAGEYTIVETKTAPGHQIDEKEYNFIIDTEGEISAKLDFVNARLKTEVEFEKVDENQELIEGAVFEVVNKDTEESYEFEVNGSHTLELPVGKYLLKEVSAPKGYVLNKEVYEFEVNSDLEVLGITQIENKYELHTVTLRKVDQDGELLDGAKFNIYKDEELVAEELEISGGEVQVDLKPGTYVIKEVSAPEGYEISQEEFEFTVGIDGSITGTTEIENTLKLYPVEIKKVDEEGELLDGAIFDIYQDGELIIEGLEVEGGKVELELTAGNYSMKEVVAPEGYELSEEEVFFTVALDGSIDGDTEIINVKIEIPEEPVEEPVEEPEDEPKDEPKEEVEEPVVPEEEEKQPEKVDVAKPYKPVDTGARSSYTNYLILIMLALVIIGYTNKRED